MPVKKTLIVMGELGPYESTHRRRNRVGPHRYLTAWAAHVFGPHGIFNLLHMRPELLSLKQSHAAKCPVCEYGTVWALCKDSSRRVEIRRLVWLISVSSYRLGLQT